MKLFYYINLIVAAMLATLIPTYAFGAYNVTRITNADGLSNSAILSIEYDSNGFLWLGTCDGVNIYDGCMVRTFSEMYPDLHLEGNIIESLNATADGAMWVQTNRGLSMLESDGRSLKDFNQFRGQERITADNKGNVFVFGEDGVIYHFANGITDNFIPLLKTGKDLQTIRHFMIRGKDLWVADHNGIMAYPLREDDAGAFSIGNPKRVLTLETLFATDNGNDFLLVEPAGNIVSVGVNGSTKILCNISGEMKKRGKIADILGDLNGNLYIAFAPGGAVKVPLSEGRTDTEDLGVKVGVFCLGRSPNQDVIWIGSDCQGLYSFSGDRYALNSYSLEDLSPNLYHPVRALWLDHRNSLWIGTKGDGVLRIDNFSQFLNAPAKQTKTLFNSSNSQLLHDNAYAFAPGEGGILWIGTDEGLNYYDYADNQVKVVDGGEGIENIHGIKEKDGILWIATLGFGIIKAAVDYQGGKPVIRPEKHLYAADGKYTSNYFFSLHEAPDGKMYFANRGLGAFVVENDSLRQIPVINDYGTRTVLDIFSVVATGDTLWLGSGHGLLKLSPEGEELFYGPTDGFENSTIHDIQTDSAGQLWISTNKGLVQFNPKTGEAHTFSKNSGLTVIEYSDGASLKTPESLLFGGIDGISVVTKNPDFLNYEPFIPTLSPRLLNISGKNVAIHKYLSSKNGETRLTLSHRDNHFSVTFTAPDFMNGANNYTFFYSLDGKNWISNGSNNTITFNEMKHGNYKLRVRYINHATNVESDPYVLSITVTPPWYLSVWAKLMCILLIMAATAAGMYLYLKRQKDVQKAQIKDMEQKHRENLYEEKLRFFTNITHEFCTPLTLMYGPCERIMSYPGADGYIRKYVGLVLSNTKRLNNLIQELIDFRRMETGHKQLKLTRINVSGLCADIMCSFSDLAERNRIEFIEEIAPDIEWNSDFECVRKTVTNLISNAFKYTPVGGMIKVSVCLANGSLVISVFNTGKGISDEDKKKIFNRYSVLDNVEENAVKGLSSRNGLGLAICHSMVEMLNGSIDIDSEVGKYANFIVSIPPKELPDDSCQSPAAINHIEENECDFNADDASELPANSPADSGNTVKPRILVIDDNREILTLLYDGLGDYHVTTAPSAEEGLKALTECVPDLIITDVMMPGTDGFQLTRQIKGNKHTMHVPLIILSAKNSTEEKIEGIESGADIYVGKPFSISYLKAVVARLLESRSKLKEYYNSSASAFGYTDGKLLSVEDKNTISAINEFIDSKIEDSELSPEMIAENFQWSLRNVYRKFKDMGLPSPNDYIKTRRINLAAKLLVTTSLTVQEIIFRTGFSNRSHFYREFDKHYSMTPKDYRNSNRSKDNSLAQ